MALVKVGFPLVALLAIGMILLVPAAQMTGNSVSESISEISFQSSSSQPDIVWEDVAMYTRHSDQSHDPRLSDQARALILATQTEFVVATDNSGGPSGSNRLVCAVVTLANGVSHYVIWMADKFDPSIGSVTVYNSQGWVTAYDSKLKTDFVRGRPRGGAEKKFVSCDNFFPPTGMIFAP